MIGNAMGQDTAPLRVERRGTLRYVVAVPIDFEGGSGTTQDVSEQGIRFLSHQRFKPLQPITFTLGFRNLTDGERTMRVRGSGHVVRLESDGVRFVVAVAVNAYSLPSL